MNTAIAPDKKPVSDPLARLLAIICAIIILLLPFHAFLTVWGASLFGHYTELRLWKEIFLVPIAAAAIVLALRHRRHVFYDGRSLSGRWIFRIAAAYCSVCIGAGLIAYGAGEVSLRALIFGLMLDLRFVLFFGLVWLVTYLGGQGIARHWKAILLLPAGVIVGFGLAQAWLLPPDFLRHFGYGHTTINALQMVDQKESYQRIQSTLRGANPLGAYLIIVLAALGALLLGRTRRAAWYAAGFAAACIVLALTFSRSAWIGTVIALGWLLFQALRSARLRRSALVAATVGCIAFAGAAYLLRDNDVFQNTFFHTDENSQSAESSNAGHFAATTAGLRDIVRQPLGGGTGTAGPASIYNAAAPGRVAENYFVQIGQEMGILGLALFVALNVVVGRELWRRRSSPLARVLLASLLGITAVNLLSHAWTDDTLSYIWWGLAGAALALAPQTKKKAKS